MIFGNDLFLSAFILLIHHIVYHVFRPKFLPTDLAEKIEDSMRLLPTSLNNSKKDFLVTR